MAIIIQNMGPSESNIDSNSEKEYDYLLRINATIICHFKHTRENGLANCLRDAAKAVELQNFQTLIDSKKL